MSQSSNNLVRMTGNNDTLVMLTCQLVLKVTSRTLSAMSALPSWYPWPETETKPAPIPLLLVQAFVNTLDVEQGVDLLGDAEATKAWFVGAGLLDDGARVGTGGVALARVMRESIRQLLESGDGDLTPLREIAATGSLRLT